MTSAVLLLVFFDPDIQRHRLARKFVTFLIFRNHCNLLENVWCKRLHRLSKLKSTSGLIVAVKYVF
jgi:hypothetical protein